MTKEQKLDIKAWIELRIHQLNNELDTWYLDAEQEAVTKAERDIYSEIKLLMDGTLVIKDDFSGLRPTKGSDPENPYPALDCRL